jgi:hypothetical protein
MARGLPEELARVIVFECGGLVSRSAWAFREDGQRRQVMAALDTWGLVGGGDAEACLCDSANSEDAEREWVRGTRMINAWAPERPPMSSALACHTQTLSYWRQQSYWTHKFQCGRTLLYWRLWATARGGVVPLAPPLRSREFDRTWWLRYGDPEETALYWG